jgi:hypothetical protein
MGSAWLSTRLYTPKPRIDLQIVNEKKDLAESPQKSQMNTQRSSSNLLYRSGNFKSNQFFTDKQITEKKNSVDRYFSTLNSNYKPQN